MKEHPILFSTAMVQAILEGRKTQTRRIIKDTTPHWANDAYREHCIRSIRCPYGKPGDRLWVREKYRKYHVTKPDSDEIDLDHEVFEFAADKGIFPIPMQDGDGFQMYNKDGSEKMIPWRPAIHLKRVDARIFLEITNVRVERLQEISKDDAIAEGINPEVTGDDFYENYAKIGYRWIDAVPSYRSLWESINGPGSWEVNPWVWVIEFKRIEA